MAPGIARDHSPGVHEQAYRPSSVKRKLESISMKNSPRVSYAMPVPDQARQLDATQLTCGGVLLYDTAAPITALLHPERPNGGPLALKPTKSASFDQQLPVREAAGQVWQNWRGMVDRRLMIGE